MTEKVNNKLEYCIRRLLNNYYYDDSRETTLCGHTVQQWI